MIFSFCIQNNKKLLRVLVAPEVKGASDFKFKLMNNRSLIDGELVLKFDNATISALYCFVCILHHVFFVS